MGLNSNQRTEIAFVMSDVPDVNTLLASLPAANRGCPVEPGPRRNRADRRWRSRFGLVVDAIHIISHGRQGTLLLGNTELSSATMDRIASHAD